jgi:hypothetical protein
MKSFGGDTSLLTPESRTTSTRITCNPEMYLDEERTCLLTALLITKHTTPKTPSLPLVPRFMSAACTSFLADHVRVIGMRSGIQEKTGFESYSYQNWKVVDIPLVHGLLQACGRNRRITRL